MGASLAAACAGTRLWCPDGRSPASAERASEAGAEPVALTEMVERAEVIVSVCPPAAAEQVGADVAAAGFAGTYVDANAIAPATSRRIAERFDRFVDGGIVGPPARSAGSTRLYLSGDGGAEVARRWAGSVLEVRLVPGGAGAASAVKACFASWTKGTAAHLLAIRALARAEGVEESLLAEWATSMPDLAERSERTAAGVGPKAWRFAGELEELAQAFADHDLPDGVGRAAAEVYRRLAHLQHAADPDLDSVVAALRDPEA